MYIFQLYLRDNELKKRKEQLSERIQSNGKATLSALDSVIKDGEKSGNLLTDFLTVLPFAILSVQVKRDVKEYFLVVAEIARTKRLIDAEQKRAFNRFLKQIKK